MPLSRRAFIKGVSTSSLFLASAPTAIGSSTRKFRTAIIGATGKGNYGHDLDLVFKGRNNVEVVGIADSDPAGLKKAIERIGSGKAYRDYQELLQKEKPDLVVIAPRWSDQHHAMAMAALNVDAHLLCEKPFTETVPQADEILALAKTKNRKVAVAHQMRLGPSIQHLKKQIENGLIGRLLKVVSHGKQDKRAGGEDMIVLGTHLFELMTFFTGTPEWCTARILENGKEISPADAKKATEEIGLVYGDDIEAQFSFANGVMGTFTSKATYRDTAGPWGMELIGERGRVHILAEVFPTCFVSRDGKWTPAGKSISWEPVPGDPATSIPREERSFKHANQRVVDDWLRSIVEDQEPVCNGRNAALALEMCHGVFQAGLKKDRVQFPVPRSGL